MKKKIHYNTITPLLHSILNELMEAAVFAQFRLVGGTALSLQFGHRLSVDIDLFTDAPYNSIDFETITKYLRNTFSYVSNSNIGVIGMGTSYIIGNSKDDSIKLDVYYTDSFIQEAESIDNIRMASAEEIIAMKFEVISQGGRKKDFWDIHELTNHYTIDQMLDLHQQRHPYGNSKDEVLSRFLDFSKAEDDLDPVCLKNKHWKLIKIDITDFARARK